MIIQYIIQISSNVDSSQYQGHTCQVTRFRRVTPGNRACHPHFPEHPSGHGFHYDDPELVQILEIFIYSENTGILPIEYKGNNKITELRTILQRKSQNS